MTDKIPVDAMAPELLEQVRRLYLQSDPASRCFQIAAQDLADSDRRNYLDQALKRGGADVRSALLSLIGETEVTSLADRARAAVLFLHGFREGFWSATPEEGEQARAVILAHYGDLQMYDKSKTDLARESELPVSDLVAVKRPPKRRAGHADDKSALDLLIQVTTEGERLAWAIEHGSPSEKLDAIERWFSIFPTFPADMIQHVNSRLTPPN